MGVVGPLPVAKTHAEAQLATAGDLIDATVVQPHAEGVAIFHEDLGEVAAAHQGAPQGGLQEVRAQAARIHDAASGRRARSRREGP